MRTPGEKRSLLPGFAAFVTILLAVHAVPVLGGALNQEQKSEPRFLQIEAIPNSGPAGSEVRIVFGRQTKEIDWSDRIPVTIYFGSKEAEVIDVSPDGATVLVPQGVEIHCEVHGRVGPLDLESALFTVIPRILGAKPPAAAPGEPVTLTWDALIPAPMLEELKVGYFSRQLSPEDVGRRTLVFIVPEDAATDSYPELSLILPGVVSELFTELEIVEPARPAYLNPWLLVPVLALFAAVGIYLWKRTVRLRIKAYRRERDAARRPAKQPGPGPEQTLPSGPDVPEIPDDLVDAITMGQCVLFAGGGVSARSGYPTWEQNLDHLIEQVETTVEAETQSERYWQSLRSSEPSEALELLTARVGREFLLSYIQEQYGRREQALPDIADSLQDLPFAGVLTTNWDDIISRIFRNRDGERILPRDWNLISDLIRRDDFFLLPFHGKVDEPETVVLTATDFRQTLEDNAPFRKFVTSIFTTRTLFFLGSSLESIESFVEALALRSSSARKHFALVPRGADFLKQSERFSARYGIELLGFNPSDGFPEIGTFLEQLAECVSQKPEGAAAPERIPALSRVVLENIGPFPSLDFHMRPGWNILLGNNGCGKSSLLRAIALGLCGDDDRVVPSAEKLLRRGEVKGFVELHVGRDVYRTDLFREGTRVRVRSRQLTPLQTGRWLVLGFPVLRGVSTKDPRQAVTEDDTIGPQVEDVLPLLEGAVDTRMDDVKQWLFNTYLRSTTEKTNSGSGTSMDRIFESLERMTPGIRLRFHGIDEDTLQLLVETNDGIVSLDLLSQGTISVIGWIGTLLRRLLAVYPESADPTAEPVLVMIDEIAAHMHPDWQYRIGKLIRDNFPNLQIIAATHSPLVVPNMQSEEVRIFQKGEDGEGIRIEPPAISFEGMRADQILTSPLFGLTSTRGSGVRRDIARYSDLLGKEPRTDEEEREFQLLRQQLDRQLQTGETEEARKVEQAVDKVLDEIHDPEEIAKSLHESEVTRHEIVQRFKEISGEKEGAP